MKCSFCVYTVFAIDVNEPRPIPRFQLCLIITTIECCSTVCLLSSVFMLVVLRDAIDV